MKFDINDIFTFHLRQFNKDHFYTLMFTLQNVTTLVNKINKE